MRNMLPFGGGEVGQAIAGNGVKVEKQTVLLPVLQQTWHDSHFNGNRLLDLVMQHTVLWVAILVDLNMVLFFSIAAKGGSL